MWAKVVSNGRSSWKFWGAYSEVHNFVERVDVTNLAMVYDIWNKPMVSITTEELKYERGHLAPHLLATLVLNEVWALDTYEYCISSCLEKICLTVSKCFHVCTHKSFAYYQLHQNKSKSFRLHLRVIFAKRNKLELWGCWSYHFLSTWYQSTIQWACLGIQFACGA